MELRPREYEAQLAAWEACVDHFEVVDPNLGLTFRVARVEMRMAVVIALDNWVNLTLVETRTFPDGVVS